MLALRLGRSRVSTKHPGSKLLCEWWALLCHRRGRLFCASGVPFSLHLLGSSPLTGASFQVALPS